MSAAYFCTCGYSYSGDGEPDYDHDPGESCCNCGGRECMDCVCRVMHDNCERNCPMCCPEFAEQAEAAAMARKQESIEKLLDTHRWNGGYFCACGSEMNSPQTWSRHVLEEAL